VGRAPEASERESVRFGTDGWRAIIAEDYTFDNVGRVAAGLVDYLRSPTRERNLIYREWGSPFHPASGGVIIGHDTRFLSREFAVHVARVVRDAGLPAILCDRFVSTPAVSYATKARGAAAGVMITSSHNPPIYNGFKIKSEYGGSAPGAVTDEVEARLPDVGPDPERSDDGIETADLVSPYMTMVREQIDLDRLAGSPIHVVIDSMHGSAQGLVAGVFDDIGVEYTQIRGTVDVTFGGTNPEPLEKNLAPLRETIVGLRGLDRRVIGVVTDGDGDRASAMDELGGFIGGHRTYALILQHLVENRGWTGPIVVAFNLSDLIRRMAKAYGLPTIEIPIGFRWAAEQILTQGDVLMAGEESGSYTVRGHIPERDGVLCSLLLAEAAASSKLPPSEIIANLHRRFGPQEYGRTDLIIETRKEVVDHLLGSPPAMFGGHEVIAVETLDGIKLRFENGWLLFRASGTEPKLRMYCEMETTAAVGEMLAAAEAYARGV